MLRNRHFQVKLAKDDDTELMPIPATLLELKKEHVEYALKSVIAVMVTRKVLNTACELVLLKAGKIA